ncbi:PBP1A family penicillin-binding protein [Enterococcus sp. 669A]|uniref:PBP1A family penicillin-binding protein n=1 Tax=Candidatus Enterococcus moelleringii TaxID=2815325 RepID=A0ABS3LGG7_9ENTE|nr:PBP1A family penicillin-binding protein [Enterococcus sp. 669A]MBO1308736.1 PBP1A family penicillin-binding protein [Enterococcus sp. 669A]
MDFKEIWRKVKDALKTFWTWIKPYLIQFHHARKRVWKKYHVNKILLLLTLVVVLIASIYLFALAKSVKVSTLESSLKQSTEIYDQKNEQAGTLYGQKGTYVEGEQISPYIKDAVVSTEDRRFYEHHGFDIRGIARAAFGSLTRGRITGGGSTITQQLAKNAYLSLDQTLERKAKELFMSIEIEKNYSKDEILTMYLNNAYFGNGVWGVQDAARKYFGKEASQVTIGEAATIAGMLKGPSIYNPIDNLENATNRRNTVLSVMVENGKLDAAQQQQESQVDLGSLLQDTYSSSDAGYRYPFYFDAVIDEAVDRYGLNEKDLLNKGYKIYTALDQNYQQQMEAVYANNYNFPANAEDGTMPQSASVALDPTTGGVEALVGRRGEHVFRGYNFATQMQRSPGSTMKPLSVYAPALEAGYTPDSILQDVPQEYYDAKNYSGTYQGEVPMYQAVAQSLNLPAVWTLHEIGLDRGFNKAKEFGIPLEDSDKYYGLALGGLEKGTSPMQMAAAYGAFANQGRVYTPHLITKIIDSTGAVIKDNSDPKYEQVISKEVADSMTSMLLGTFSNGTAVQAAPAGYTMAGKTGTTETNFDATKVNDQWIVGYTPHVVISTWLGFEKTSETHYLSGTSGDEVGQVFKAEAESILPYAKQGAFNVADAYATGGQVVPADQVATPEENNQWQEDLKNIGEKATEGLNGFGEKAKQGLQQFGEKAKEGLGQLKDKGIQWWQEQGN